MRPAVASFALLLAILSSGCASARKVLDGHPDGIADTETAGFFFQEENDVLAPGNRDKFYTQGLRWGKTVNPHFNPRPVQAFGQWFGEICCRQLNYGGLPVWTSGIAQTMFTPDDITVHGPQPHDRPWAGFIYLDNTFRYTERGSSPKTQVVLEFQTGTTGKRSGAEWAQSALHAVIDSPHPAWFEQLERPLAGAVIYTWNKRPFAANFFDVLPYGGGALGNTQSYFNAGGYLRAGWNLRGFMNTGAMQGTFAVDSLGDQRPSWDAFGYVGGNAAYVWYNYFLSNGDFRRERRVHDLMMGASIRVRSYRLTYNFVRRSRELTHPLGPQFRAHDYGSLVLSYELAVPSRKVTRH